MAVEIHQRTTLFHDFFIRVVGVIGGVWVCARWAFKIGGKAVEVVSGKKDDDHDLLVEESRSSARKSRWVGGSLNKRPSMARMGWDSDNTTVTHGHSPSPSWSATGVPVGSTPSTPVPYSPFMSNNGAPSPAAVPIPPSPYTPSLSQHSHSPWGPSTPGSGSFPTSPLPPMPQSAGPYTPSFNRSISGASSSSSSLPIPPSPGGTSPYTPGASSIRPGVSPYAARSSSSLNPNRSVSGLSPVSPNVSAEKKAD